MAFSVTYTDPAQLSDRQLLQLVYDRQTTILERLETIMATATDTKTAVDSENTKVDALIAAVTPALQTLRDALAAALAENAALKAGEAADAVTLQTAVDAANAEGVKVDAAIAALTPPPAAP